MNVFNPLGGRRLLLQWWTHDTRGHVVLAESRRSLEVVVDRVIREHGDARAGVEIRAFALVELVAPPERFSVEQAAFERRDVVEAFRQEVCWRVHEAFTAEETLPEPFSWCAHADEDECTACTNGVLVGMTDEAFHVRYASAWPLREERRVFSRSKPPAPRNQHGPSRARVATESVPLFYAYADFGHHAGGVDLLPVEEGASGRGRPRHLSGSVLFFYQVVEELDRGPLVDRVAAEQAKIKAFKARIFLAGQEKRDAEKREWHAKLRAYFGVNP